MRSSGWLGRFRLFSKMEVNIINSSEIWSRFAYSSFWAANHIYSWLQSLKMVVWCLRGTLSTNFHSSEKCRWLYTSLQPYNGILCEGCLAVQFLERNCYGLICRNRRQNSDKISNRYLKKFLGVSAKFLLFHISKYNYKYLPLINQ